MDNVKAFRLATGEYAIAEVDTSNVNMGDDFVGYKNAVLFDVIQGDEKGAYKVGFQALLPLSSQDATLSLNIRNVLFFFDPPAQILDSYNKLFSKIVVPGKELKLV